MGSPSCCVFCAVAAAVDWVRIPDGNRNDGDAVDDKESNDILAVSDEDEPTPRRDAVLLFDGVLHVPARDERDLVTVQVVFFAETRAMHLMAREAPVDIIVGY